MIIPLLLSLIGAQEGGWTPPPPPPVVPTPLLAQPRFAPFALPDEARIVAVDEELGRQATLLQDALEMRLGRRIPIGAPPAASGDLILSLGYLADPVAEQDEAFAIEVFSDHVSLAGSDAIGAARAIARLAQLFRYDEEAAAWTLPPTRIDDAPAHAWRGLMLDLARFPHPVESVREAIDLAFLFSLNVVHLHLADDQAFTFPASFLPERTDPGQPGRDRGYRPEDIAFLVQYAHDRGVELVPEIDMPAHSSALVRARPDLFGRIDPETGEAVSTGVVNMTSTLARTSMKGLVDEVIAAFPYSRFFHLGGDEVWAPDLLKLPAYEALRSAESLPAADASGAMNALLNWFLCDMAEHVKEAGRQPIVWEGFRPVEGGQTVPADVWVMAWNQRSQTPEALLEAGHTVINCGWEPLYIVPAQSWATQPRDAFDWNPRSLRQRFGGRVASVEEDAALMGAQICVWEQRPEAIVPAVLRVIPEIAERMWGSHATPETFEAFEEQATAAAEVVRDMLRPVEFVWSGDLGGQSLLFQEKGALVLRPSRHAPPGTVRYEIGDTFDAAPGPRSKAAGAEPLVITESAVVSAALFADDGRQLGGVTRVRLEKGTPIAAFEAFQLDPTSVSGGRFTAEDFDGWSRDASLGMGWLMAPTPARIDAINREQFARVRPEAHVDLRPISWIRLGPRGQRIDPLRPRLTGQHGLVATAVLEVPEAGVWTIEMRSRGGVGRLTVGAATLACAADDRPVLRRAKLESGRYGVRIEHAMLDVHNDLQVVLIREGTEKKIPLTSLLRAPSGPGAMEGLLELSDWVE